MSDARRKSNDILEAILDMEIVITEDWQDYPVTLGLTNVTGIAKYKRQGSDLIGRIDMTFTGTPTGTFLTASIPAGLEVDISNIPGIPGTGTIVGSMGGLDNGVAWMGGYVAYQGTTNIVGVVKDGSAGYKHNRVSPTVPVSFVAGDVVTYEFRVPIVDWDETETIRQRLGL